MQDHKCHNEERIRSVENDRTESKVYIKQINENLQEIKTDVRGLKKSPLSIDDDRKDTFKQNVVMELIRLLTMLIGILAALFGAVKFLER